MRYRTSYIENSKTLSDQDSLIIDLDVVDPVSALWLEWQNKNGSTSNQANPIHRCVSKIELVDGSDALFALSLPQAQALNFFEQKAIPVYNYTEEPNDYPREGCWIYFGRYLNDPRFYLLPNKFRNLQLKLTHNFNAVRDVDAATAYVSGYGRLSVIAHLMEDPPAAPEGFLMSKEHYAWTTAGSGEERIDLPRDYPYRFFMLRSYEASMGPWENVSNLKLNIDQDKYIPFDLETLNMVVMNMQRFGTPTVGGKWNGQHNDTLYHPIYRVHGINIYPKAAGYCPGSGYAWTGMVNLSCLAHDGSALASDIDFFMQITGGCFQSAVAWPFGEPDDPSTWLPVQDYGSIKLIATQADADAAASVVLQQLRDYR